MNLNLIRAVSRLVKFAPPLLAEWFSPDCCIGATRVACGVLNKLGFDARPQPTRLTVYTKKLWKRVESQTFSYPFVPDEWSVGVGFREDERSKTDPNFKGYEGHLVALCDFLLIDLSIGQASRPHKGIVLPPAMFIPYHKFKINNCVLFYTSIDNQKFTESPDWTDASRTQPIIEELLRLI